MANSTKGTLLKKLVIGGSVVLFGKNRDSEIGLWLPNCPRCARTILLTTANFRTLFFPNTTTDPPITYANPFFIKFLGANTSKSWGGGGGGGEGSSCPLLHH